MGKMNDKIMERMIELRAKSKSYATISKEIDKEFGEKFSREDIFRFVKKYSDEIKIARDRIAKDIASPSDINKVMKALEVIDSESLLNLSIADMWQTICELNDAGDIINKKRYYDTFIKYIKQRSELIGEAASSDTAIIVSDYFEGLRKKVLLKER